MKKYINEAIDEYEILQQVAEPFVNALNKIESNEDNCYITWNFGFDKDGCVTAGVDLRLHPKFETDEKIENELKSKVEEAIKIFGFELDPNIIHDNPSKNIFGGWHYQIRESECNNTYNDTPSYIIDSYNYIDSVNNDSLENTSQLSDDELENYRNRDSLFKDYEGNKLWQDVQSIKELIPEATDDEAEIIEKVLIADDKELYRTDDGAIIVAVLSDNDFGYRDVHEFISNMIYQYEQDKDFYEGRDLFESLKEAINFSNNIKQDLINGVNSDPKLITNKLVKSSKSAIPNALYYVDKGEEVNLCIGNANKKNPNINTHVWVEHNKQVAQTGIPKDFNGQLFPNIRIGLIPHGIEASKEKIKTTLESM